MSDFARSIVAAFTLIGGADAELLGIVALSVRVSLTAGIAALLIGAPIGALLAITRFRGRQVVIVLSNALLGLPPVVVGLGLYLLLAVRPARRCRPVVHTDGHGDRADAARNPDRGRAGAPAREPAVG